ncbi:MAG: hypothetical protein U5L02_08675 [Rheinheimera sp.]|nr:hypothetical protein [Rheinheimera sp.]
MFRHSGALDHCFVVQNAGNSLQPLATLTSPDQQLSLTVLSDLPGVQIYSGVTPYQHLFYAQDRASVWKHAILARWAEPARVSGSPVLLAGEKYQHQIIYRFARQNGLDSND